MGYNTAEVRLHNSFAEAKKRYMDTPPIRGNKHNIRPLGSRRHHYMASMVMPNADTVDFQFFGKAFVRWHADDTFEVFCPTYYSAYAPDNCSHFLPGELRMRWKDCRMFLVHDGKEYLIQAGDVLKFSKVGKKYFFLNKPVAHNYRKIRGALDNVMQKYVPFLDWLQVVSAVTNEFENAEREYAISLLEAEAGVATHSQITAEADKRNRQKEIGVHSYELWALANKVGQAPYSTYRNAGFCTEHCAVLERWVTSDNAEDWVNAMKLIAFRYGDYSYQKQVYQLKFVTAFDALKNIASHLHRTEVFERVRLPDGKAPSRTNSKFFHAHKIPTLAELSTFGR